MEREGSEMAMTEDSSAQDWTQMSRGIRVRYLKMSDRCTDVQYVAMIFLSFFRVRWTEGAGTKAQG